MNYATLSIVIPVYNEERTLVEILDKIGTVKLIGGLVKELVIVNDCSTDTTENIIKEYISTHDKVQISYVAHSVNKGKGAALSTGIKESKGEIIIIQDADLEYDPHEYNRLLQPILDGFADVVYGSRFKGSNPHRALFFLHTF